VANPGVVYKYVEMPGDFDDSSGDVSALGFIDDIKQQKLRASAVGDDFINHAYSGGRIAVSDKHSRSGSRECGGDRCTNTGSGAGNERGFSIKGEHLPNQAAEMKTGRLKLRRLKIKYSVQANEALICFQLRVVVSALAFPCPI
jgi:hypothetical protein